MQDQRRLILDVALLIHGPGQLREWFQAGAFAGSFRSQRRLARASARTTSASSFIALLQTRLPFQDLHRFHGLRPDCGGSALPVPAPKDTTPADAAGFA